MKTGLEITFSLPCLMRGSKVSASLCFYVTFKGSLFHRAVLCSGTVWKNPYYLLDCFSPHLLLVICLKSASNSKELYLNPVLHVVRKEIKGSISPKESIPFLELKRVKVNAAGSISIEITHINIYSIFRGKQAAGYGTDTPITTGFLGYFFGNVVFWSIRK